MYKESLSKGYVLAYFIAKFAFLSKEEQEEPKVKSWLVFVDNLSCHAA